MSEKTCGACGGSGSLPCQGCSGSGTAQKGRLDEAREWSSCAACHGSGSVTCRMCGGSGKESS